MFDSIRNVGDFLSPHWLSEAFPGKLKVLTKQWRERADHGKHSPQRGLSGLAGRFIAAKAELPRRGTDGYSEAVTQLHAMVLEALGFRAELEELETEWQGTPLTVPLLARVQSPTGEALHALQAVPVSDADDLFAAGDLVEAGVSDTGEGLLLEPIRVHQTEQKDELVVRVAKAVEQLFLTGDAPRFVLVLAGGWLLLSDVERWAEGRYLAIDLDTALSRKDDKATGELAWLAGLVSADVLLPAEDGKSLLAEFTDDSVKHAVGVSEDLREGLRVSVELIANEVIAQRRQRGEAVDGIAELPRELTTQSLRFLYRVLFLLYAEARPELKILPVGAPEYDAGYGLDRLRELIQRPLTGASRDGSHFHDSLRLLFRLVNQGYGHDEPTGDGLTFEPLRADLFDPKYAHHIDNVNLSNAVLQQVLALLLLSKPSKSKGSQRGYVSYAQLGINQLGAVYEGLMAYSGFIADRELVELAKDGDPGKGTWLVPREKLGEYDEKHVVRRENPLTGAKDFVLHRPGTFVYRLSGRDRQRSASYYTPEVLTQCVVRHSLAELIAEDTPAQQILEYRICEPAMGSGAFLNEAINQLAAEYLDRRQSERNLRIDPEEYRTELQKVKAYLALHRCYGVDLNNTARELAEVSLWLNVMHSGLKAPWFGLHLKRGNSLIGARRATYDLTALGRAKQSWLKSVPKDRPLIDGEVPDGEIHHFLLPAAGWGAVKDAKQAKELVPDQVTRLKEWAKAVTRKPGKDEVARLKGLARRVERLWELSRRRLEMSEREVSRYIDVWGAEVPAERSEVTRERVEEELIDPESPYQRLRLVMDAWCALFFWPVTTDVEPPDLGQWITVLEGLLGVSGQNKVRGQLEFIESVEHFGELTKFDELEMTYFGMKNVAELVAATPWLGRVREISREEGFFHWELDFAQVFSRGGFDLQVGNPPWVKLEWQENEMLAEFDPAFILPTDQESSFADEVRNLILSDLRFADRYLLELSSLMGVSQSLSSIAEHPILVGVTTNLYTSFMERMWRSMAPGKIVGVLHQESHLSDPNARQFRTEAYRRLRRHWQFSNQVKLFADVGNTRSFGIHIYGDPKEVSFRHISGLVKPETVDESLAHDGVGEVPAIQFPSGGWDSRPHALRVIDISENVLTEWSRLFDDGNLPALGAQLIRPYSQYEMDGLSAMSNVHAKVANLQPGVHVSNGWVEGKIKGSKWAKKRTDYPDSWAACILQGPHISVSNPFAKSPNDNCRSHRDWVTVDLEGLPQEIVPRTNYQVDLGAEEFEAGIHFWGDIPYTSFWRVIWRRRVDSYTERTLEAAILPRGAMHVHGMHTLSAVSDRNTAQLVGLWSSLPYDYLVKVSGKTDVTGEVVRRFPAPLDHPAARYLLLRALRLNCLTRDYAPLWEELYEPGFADDRWTEPFKDWPNLGVRNREWTMETPLRSDFERRAALVELDALAAIMLGLTADQLCLMYRGQFAVLRKYEYNMYFDNLGRKIAKDHHAHGVKQQPEDFKLLQAYLDGEPCGDLLDRYKEPITPVDREAEMRAAYADFTERLK